MLSAHNTAVLDQLSSFHWDAPDDCLLALSKCVGAHMGGTSGAVRDTQSFHHIINKINTFQIYSIFLMVVANAVSKCDMSSLADAAVWTKALRHGMEAIKRSYHIWLI